MEIKKYVKKPIAVEALQWTGCNGPEMMKFCGKSCDIQESSYPDMPQYRLYIRTLEGRMYADIGSYIIKGVEGEFYPCKKEIFESTYVETTENSEPKSITTIDDAIRHCEEIINDPATGKCCASEHLQLRDWLIELKELRTKYQYAIADIRNIKRRNELEKTKFINTANRDVILDLLPIVDNMQGVVKSIKDSGNLESSFAAIAQGFDLIVNDLRKLLDSEGCEQIDANVGDEFNVKFHEAVVSEESEQESGTITRIFSPGYVLNGTLLRPTKVGVAK